MSKYQQIQTNIGHRRAVTQVRFLKRHRVRDRILPVRDRVPPVHKRVPPVRFKTYRRYATAYRQYGITYRPYAPESRRYVILPRFVIPFRIRY